MSIFFFGKGRRRHRASVLSSQRSLLSANFRCAVSSSSFSGSAALRLSFPPLLCSPLVLGSTCFQMSECSLTQQKGARKKGKNNSQVGSVGQPAEVRDDKVACWHVDLAVFARNKATRQERGGEHDDELTATRNLMRRGAVKSWNALTEGS